MSIDKQERQKIILAELGKMFIATGKKADLETLHVFMESLSEHAKENHFSFEEVIEAIKQAKRTTAYAPKVADIIKFLQHDTSSALAELQEDIPDAVHFIKEKWRQGLWDNPFSKEDPLHWRAYNIIAEMDWEDEASLKYLYSKYEKTILNLFSQPKHQNNLLLQEAQEKAERKALYSRGGSILDAVNEKCDTKFIGA